MAPEAKTVQTANAEWSAAEKPGKSGFWGQLANSNSYQRFTDLVFASKRRQFILLAAFPIFWVLFAHLGPILQMFWVSFLDSYPPTVGIEPQLTLANWASFFEQRIFLMPF
ncbi:MAG: ABC transporter permease, partial [Alphaproteobacteria bacterium]